MDLINEIYFNWVLSSENERVIVEEVLITTRLLNLNLFIYLLIKLNFSTVQSRWRHLFLLDVFENKIKYSNKIKVASPLFVDIHWVHERLFSIRCSALRRGQFLSHMCF
jgi:hypothetical protein